MFIYLLLSSLFLSSTSTYMYVTMYMCLCSILTILWLCILSWNSFAVDLAIRHHESKLICFQHDTESLMQVYVYFI